MWTCNTYQHHAGLVGLALMSMWIVAGNGRDSELGPNRAGSGSVQIPTALKKANVNEVAISDYRESADRIANNLDNPSSGTDDALMKSAVLYGVLSEIIQLANSSSDSDICRQNARSLFDGITSRQLWALKGMYIANIKHPWAVGQ